MRNLKLLHSVRVGDAFELANTQQMCIDYDTKVVYCATSTGVYGLDPDSQQIVSQISLVDEGYGSPPGGSDVVVVGIEHLPDQMSVCVATGGGDVLLWNTTNNQLECVGSVEHGLTAMCWSTDQELVVLATGQNTLIMMTREFEPVTEVAMFSDQFGEAEFINVGWGKKETQFHGSEGKAAAFVKKPETVSPATDWDDNKPRICWHSDGQYFVVSAIEPDTGCRRLRVWTRDCRLYSTSEIVDGLEQALGWKSTGNLITTSQHRPNRHDIIFFERNGLRHGEFSLPFGVNQVKVLEVHWNRDSTILAVWLEELPPDGSTSFVPHSFVHLWSVSNYHWYLKQSLKFSATDPDRISALCWDQEHANRLHVVCKSGQYLQYTWGWTTDNSPVMTGEQSSTNTAVIDGANVLVTPFHQMVIPPPMCAYKLCLSSPVNQVTFAPASYCNELAVLTDSNQVAIFSFDKDIKSPDDSHVKVEVAGGNGFSVQCNLPVFKGLYGILDDPTDVSYPLKFYHMTWCKRDVMLFFMLNIMGTETEIHHGIIGHETGEIKICHTSTLSGYIYNTALNSQTCNLMLEMAGGQILQYNPDDYSITPWLTPSGKELMYSPSKLCTQIDMCTVGGQEVVLGLTDQYQFYVNEIQIATNCTSFAVHDEFLLLTTYSHTCRCINRKTALNALSSLADDKTHTFDESIRRVERGSRIVTVVGGDTRLILQMPRGNLETIHPRALVLCAVRKHLDRLEFRKAFVLMRKHRINMNLIHDHDPELFLSNVDRFIHQVETPSWINLFITDLQEDDVTKTMYTAAYVDNVPVVPPGEEPERSSKIDRICDRLKEGLERIDSNKYLLSILTAHVKKSTPELDIALKKIRDLKAGNVQGSVSAEDALNYLLFLVDVNEMYDVALGMYDFELVLMVAEKSQKDPKEYIAYLNTLRKMEENFQRYTIDKHLKRYTSALKHIIKCGEDHFLECLQLVKEHRLYREAMLCYTPGSKEYKEIAMAYGEFLLEKQHPEEAGLLFSKAECWQSAIEAFKESLNWQLALCMAYKAGYDHTQLEQLCKQLVTSLKDQSRYKEAAVIIEQHLDDLEEAIVTLIDGGQWEEALRMMYKTQRTDFIETHLNDALIQSYTQLVMLFDSVRVEFQHHKTRLAVVRAKKERDRLEFLEGTADHNVADADLFSDTSSATGESITSRQSTTYSNRSTIFSKRSGKSAKTRRKHERKKWSLKEGSPYEDIALVEALSKICKQTEEWKGEVSSLLRMLMLFNHVEAAAKLQEQFEALHNLVLKSLDEIWPKDAENNGTEIINFGPDSTANVIVEAMRQGCKIESETKLDRSMRIRPHVSKDNKWKLHSAVMLNR